MTLNEFVYSIAKKINKQEDYEFIEGLKSDVNSKRAYFLQQERPRIINWEPFIQTIPCAEVTEGSMVECCGITVEDCDKVLRTTLEIPTFIQIGVAPFIYVGDDSYSVAYTYVTPEQIKNVLKIPIMSSRPLYALSQNKLILINPPSKLVEQVVVKGVFLDPDDLIQFQCKDTGACYDHDKDYPASGDMMEIIRKDIYRELGIVQPSTEREIKPDDGKVV